MTYYMFIETGCAIEAESEEDAREQAIAGIHIGVL